MLFSTPTQYAVLALLLVAGWLFGLASSSGGKRWRERYAAERDAHAATRRDLEARHADASRRVTEVERGNDDRLATANAHIAELERENERLRTAAPVTGATVAPVGTTTIVHPTAGDRTTYVDPARPDDVRRL
jgi:hypothetical protein